MKKQMGKFIVATALVVAAGKAGIAAKYQDTVKALNPTFYYELNETDTSKGAIDSMGRGPIGEYNGDYDGGGPEVGISGPDFLIEGGAWTTSAEWLEIGAQVDIVGLGANNWAHASNNAGHITLGDGKLFSANAMTVSLFALGGPADGGDRVFTNNLADPLKSFQIVVGNDGIVVSTNPALECSSEIDCGHRSLYLPGEGTPNKNDKADRGLNNAANHWWHIVASTHGATAAERTENIELWLNGVNRTSDMLPGTTGWGVDTGLAKIGGRRDSPTDSTTHSGAQDEVAIWLNRTLTGGEALSLYNAAVGISNSDCNKDGKVDKNDLQCIIAAGGSGALNSLLGELKLPAGDLDANGTVEFADFLVLSANFGKDVTAYPLGDIDANGKVEFADFLVLSSNFGKGGAAAAAVPEPTIGLGLLGCLGLWGRRRRND